MKKLLFFIPVFVMFYSCHLEVSPPPLHISERNNTLEDIKELCNCTEDKCVREGDLIFFVDEGYLFLFSVSQEEKYYMKKANIKKILKYKNGLLVLNQIGTLYLALDIDTYDVIHNNEIFVKDVKVQGNDIHVLLFDDTKYYYKGTEYPLRKTTVGITGNIIIIDSKDLGFWSVDRRVYISTKADDEEVFFGS